MTSPTGGLRTCPACARPVQPGTFDFTVGGDGEERHFFGLEAAVCRRCDRLVLDADTTRLFRIDPDAIRAAIASDVCLAGEWSSDAA